MHPGGGNWHLVMFQYPLTDRLGWNLTVFLHSPQFRPVSVSSNGSIGVEHVASTEHGFIATAFQYPLTDRLGWNRLRFPTEKGQK